MVRSGSMPPEPIDHIDQANVDDAAPLPADPKQALELFTQLNGPSAQVAAHACGALSVVAAALLTGGYKALQTLAQRLKNELSEQSYQEIQDLADQIARGGDDANYGTLGALAQTLQRRFRTFDGGMPYDHLRHLMGIAGFRPPQIIKDDRIDITIPLSGQCWPAKIALNNQDTGDHWILVARDKAGLLIYDPYPRADSSQIIRFGERDWNRYAALIRQEEEDSNTIGFLPRFPA